MRVLMVAEKPSIAQSIAAVLSKGSYKSTKGRGTAILEWDGQFKGQQATFMMTSVLGHVYTLDFPPSIGWGVDPRTLFDAPTEKKEANPNSHICQHLQQVARGCHSLVLWLDCDREGENIAFEVMENCEPKMVSGHSVWRARFSAISGPDLHRAMSNLVKPNRNESLSIDARREIDLKVGVAFTRYQTTTFHFRYANLDAQLISYGPCQTPTLGFCVDRYDEIQHFKPTPYYKLVAHISRSGVKTKLKWQRGRIMKDRPQCLSLMQGPSSAGWAKCIDVKTSTSKITRPIPLNTVALMKVASSMLGLGPQQCMSHAEHLYMSGWISYPRTESSAYPQHFNMKDVLADHAKHPQWGNTVAKLMSGEMEMKKAKAGVDAGDHPPITPMRMAVRDRDITGNDWRIYEYIATHFIATVCPDAIIENQVIVYDLGGEKFTSNGSTLIQAGFTEVTPWSRPSDKYMASVKIGDQSSIESVTIKEGYTKPPTFLSETELISLMEKHGIGTDASISTHIENIQRNYVKLHSQNRTLEPNKLGISLVHGYHRIDPELVLPKIRASIENQVSEIALGKASYEDVLKRSLATFLQKFDHFVENVGKMDELFHASFSSLGDVQVNTRLKPKCGKCDRFMKYIHTKPHRLYCTICEEVYSMPKDGSLKSDGLNLMCPLDGFELVVHTDRKGKTTRLCPKCFNSPTFPGMKAGGNCSTCPNKECKYNLSNFIIEDTCPICDVGFLSIEPTNGRRIDCNLCTYHLELPQDANKINVPEKSVKCDKCKFKSTKIYFKYSTSNTPMDDKSATEFTACVRCDHVMAPLCAVKGLPGMREPRKGGRFSKSQSTASTTTSSLPTPTKFTETQYYSLAAIAAVTKGRPVQQQEEEEEEQVYESYEPTITPPTRAVNLMDMVVIHKSGKTPATQSSGASTTQSSGTGNPSVMTEWPEYHPADFELNTKRSMESSSQHLHREQYGRNQQYGDQSRQQRGQYSDQNRDQRGPQQHNNKHSGDHYAKNGGGNKQYRNHDDGDHHVQRQTSQTEGRHNNHQQRQNQQDHRQQDRNQDRNQQDHRQQDRNQRNYHQQDRHKQDYQEQASGSQSETLPRQQTKNQPPGAPQGRHQYQKQQQQQGDDFNQHHQGQNAGKRQGNQNAGAASSHSANTQAAPQPQEPAASPQNNNKAGQKQNNNKNQKAQQNQKQQKNQQHASEMPLESTKTSGTHTQPSNPPKTQNNRANQPKQQGNQNKQQEPQNKQQEHQRKQQEPKAAPILKSEPENPDSSANTKPQQPGTKSHNQNQNLDAKTQMYRPKDPPKEAGNDKQQPAQTSTGSHSRGPANRNNSSSAPQYKPKYATQ